MDYRGEKENIKELIDKYSNIMLHIALSYCSSLTDAQDIVQEVFYKYVSKGPTFQNDDHEKAWFLRVTINTSKDYIKSYWFRKTESLSENIPYNNSNEKYIWELVHKLPSKYRIVIQLFYQEGYSIKEVADILKLRESTVTTQLERARKRLKKLCLED